jgi:hypothetical protein
MHMQGEPGTMQQRLGMMMSWPSWMPFLMSVLSACAEAGIDAARW